MAQAITLSGIPEATVPRSRSPWQQILFSIVRNPPAFLGLILVILVVLTAIFAPMISPYPFDKQDLTHVVNPPSLQHLLGTDQLGRDVLSRMIWGARSVVFVIVMTTLLDLGLGIPFGAIAGFFGGLADTVIMRVADILFAFPGLLFVFFIVSTIKPGILTWSRGHGLADLARSGYLDYGVVIIALGLIGWAGLARLIRAQVMAVKERDFILGARAIGVPTWKIIARHVLPNSLAPVIVALSMGMGDIALTEGYLSFIGIGLQPPNASWGNMIADNANLYWRRFPEMIWMVWAPGIILAAVVFAFNFLGDGLNEALNPEITK
jgi:peptide/nickel transport system permease protein